ncbi:MAG: Zn-ribbon domain-containing OB-fold protein [Chloroflexi bacterium]|nr:Zn-ribbon domain-containing OB-fold protein [Chloroflexota bacterium]
MILVPGVTEVTRPYWEGTRAGQLLLQRCSACGHMWHPPLPRCPACHSEAFEWVPASGRGTVYSYAIVQHATHAAFADKVPYMTALVQLEEGPRVLTNLRRCDAPAVGLPVRVVFEELADGTVLPQFEPA